MTYDEQFAKNIGGKIARDASDDGKRDDGQRDNGQRDVLGLRCGETSVDGSVDGSVSADANPPELVSGVPHGSGTPQILNPQAAEGGQVRCADPSTQDDEECAAPSQRHDGWTPEVRVKFLEALANCGNVTSAALFVQRSRTSAYSMKRRDMGFARGWDAALLLARDVATDCLQDRAMNGVEDDVYHQGEVVGTRRRYDSRLLLAHIARLDKLAERISVSRGAGRFDEMLDAIAAEEDTTALITEPTIDEIAGIIAETEAQGTVRKVEAACLRERNAEAEAKFAAEASAKRDEIDPDVLARADAQYGPMHEIDWGDGTPIEYSRMFPADAEQISADYPRIKTRMVAMDDPAFVAAIVAPNAARMAKAEIAAAESA